MINRPETEARTILLVEDDPTLLEAIRYNLGKEGYQVVAAVDGIQALEQARQANPDLVILDIMLPRLDGLEVCRALRRDSSVPIIMLTAKSGETDTVLGLEMGADDYLAKPFRLRELLARVKAQLRRAEMPHAGSQPALDRVQFGRISVERESRRVFRDDKEIGLTLKEYDLLEYLRANAGKVISREVLLDKVWGYGFAGDSRTVDVHVRWLREKIEDDPANPQHIRTVRGVGYRLEP
ncbi:MAG TPA: response regulator transcription factor [Chloroflexota bacterium]|nr:response regulator transcription factor [Chloroflexota bacterium]